jgi:hypothetical protein
MTTLTADDIIPLVVSLPDSERIRLLRWISSPYRPDNLVYGSAPRTREEFSTEDEPNAWDADGWEEFY